MDIFKLFGTIAVNNSEANKAIDDTAKASRKIGDGFKDSRKTTGKSLKEIAAENGKTVGEIRSEAMKLAAEYKRQGMSVSEATKKAYADMGYAAKSTHKEINEEIDDTVEEMGGLSDSLVEVSEQTEKTSGGFTIMKGILADLAATAVKKMISAGSGLVKSIIDTGAEFDSQMSTVASISGATAEEFETLRAKAQEMGATTAFSASESAQALEYMAMAGWSTSEMTDGLAGVMNLAAASGEDLAATSDIVTDAMTAFGMSADQSTYFSDVLAKTASSANTNVGLMGETFKYIAPLAGAMNYSIEDMSVAIGLMANAGIKGSQSGTSLRNIITNLASPTDTVVTAMEALGISLVDSDGKTKTFSTTLSEMRESFADLDEVQRTQYASAIAGKEGMSGFLALINSSDSDFEALTKSIENCAGASEEMAKIRLDNLEGDVTLFKSAVEGAKIAVSDKLSPVLRDIVQKATEVIPKIQEKLSSAIDAGKKAVTRIKDAFSPFIDKLKIAADESGILDKAAGFLKDSLKKTVDVIVEIGKGLDKFTGWLQSGKKSAELFKSGVIGLATAFTTYKVATTGVTKALTIGKKAVDAYRKAQTLLNATNPVGWITIGVSAFAGLATAIESMPSPVDEMRESFSKLSDEEQALVDRSKELKESCDEWDESRRAALEDNKAEFDYYQRLAEELDTIVDKNGKIKEGYEDRARVITGELSEALGIEIGITDGVIDKYSELQKEIEKTILIKEAQAALDAEQSFYMEAQKNIDGAKMKLAENQQGLKDINKEIADARLEYVDLLTMSLEDYEEKYGHNGGKTIGDTQTELKGRIDGLIERQEQLQGSLRTSEETFYRYRKSIENNNGVAAAIVSKDTDSIKRSLDDLYNGFVTCETGTKEMLQKQEDDIRTEYENMRNAVKEGNTVITQEDIDAQHIRLNRAIDENNKKAQEMKRGAEEAGDKYAEGITSKNETVSIAVKNMIESGYSSNEEFTRNTAKQLGEMFSQGFADGIEEAAFLAVAGAAQMASSAMAAVQHTIDSHSPSRKTAQFGRFFTDGFAIGITENVGSAVESAKTMADSTLNSLRNNMDSDVGFTLASRSDISEAGIKAQSRGTAEKTESVHVNNNSDILSKLTELIEVIKKQKIYLDGRALVGGIADEIDSALGMRSRLKRRGI